MDEIKKQEVKEIPLKEKIDAIFNQITQADKDEKSKKKAIKLIKKAKVRKRKIKKGWVGVLKIDENGNISGEKEKIIGGTIKSSEGTYHATDGREILFWQGKFPVIIQPSWKKNPLMVKKENEVNETYGQKYIMARMMVDTIKVKTGGGAKAILWIAGLAIAGYIAYTLLKGGL